MKIALENVVWKEGEFYVAKCLNVEVSSFGDTRIEALRKLQEALICILKIFPWMK